MPRETCTQLRLIETAQCIGAAACASDAFTRSLANWIDAEEIDVEDMTVEDFVVLIENHEANYKR